MYSHQSTVLISFYVTIFSVGIVSADYLNLSEGIKIFTILVGIWVAAYILLRQHIILVSVGLLFLVCGFVKFYISAQEFPPPELEVLKGESHIYSGNIVSEVERRKAQQRFVIELRNGERSDSGVSSKALVYVPAYPEFSYGDSFNFEGALLKPIDFKTDAGTWFDYNAYLAKDDIFYVVKNPRIFNTEHNKGNWLLGRLYKIKNNIIETIERMLPSPQSSLLAGLLIAGKKSIPADVMNDFKIAGIVHMVVLSGYNVTIIAVAIMTVLAKVKRKVRLFIGAVLIVLFSLMVGETATVVRSVIMALMALFAQMLYRDFDVIRALVLSAFLMLLWNPYYLMHDPSFQLSFLATIGLILCSPPISYVLSKVLPKLVAKLLEKYSIIKELLVASLSTQIFVLPYILYGTGILSLVALPANILILIFIPLTMLSGFIGIVLQWFIFMPLISFVAVLINFFTYVLLSYELGVAHFLASLPFAAIYTKHVPLWSVFVAYFAYTVILFWFYQTGNFKRESLILELRTDSHSAPS